MPVLEMKLICRKGLCRSKLLEAHAKLTRSSCAAKHLQSMDHRLDCQLQPTATGGTTMQMPSPPRSAYKIVQNRFRRLPRYRYMRTTLSVRTQNRVHPWIPLRRYLDAASARVCCESTARTNPKCLCFFCLTSGRNVEMSRNLQDHGK